MKKIPGYGDKYRLLKDGTVLRRSNNPDFEWDRVSISPKGARARVRLYRPGAGDKPRRLYVKNLLRDIYSLEVAQAYVQKYGERF